MAEKPRVKAPKKRAPSKAEAAPDRRRLLVIAGGGALLLAAVAGVFFLLGTGGSKSPEDARAALEAAGCKLQIVDALAGSHTIVDPDGTSKKWNTDPPTSGPHYGFNPNGTLGTVIWGAYEEPVQLARVVHNLEHGGIIIFYGEGVSQSVVEQLRSFYEGHERGTMLAPYPKLANKIALGAWVAESEPAKGYLATCTEFDEDAFSTFFAAFQFKGPEPVPESQLLPGGN
ncbi:MAG: DUF3105 domain-containing protein [Actinobacteria bacterium]|nr:DUF3105 domain-containing protein [Actinomycetota bacterium]